MKELQAKLEQTASLRRFWREMLASITDSKTKGIMEKYRERIQAKADEYIERYDNCDPEDRINIAKSQEGRILCKSILRELDPETCKIMISGLDKEIKSLTNEIESVSKKKEEINGYSILHV